MCIQANHWRFAKEGESSQEAIARLCSEREAATVHSPPNTRCTRLG